MSNSAHQVARIPSSTRNGGQRTPGLETSWPQWMARRSRGRCQQGRRNLLARRAQVGRSKESACHSDVSQTAKAWDSPLAIGVLQMLVSWFTAQMNERRAAAARTDTPFRCRGTGQSFEVRGAFVPSWIFGPRLVVEVVFNGLRPRGLRHGSRDVEKSLCGKGFGPIWNRGTARVCAQHPRTGTFQGSMGRMVSSSSSF